MPTIPPFPTVALGDVDGDGDLDLVSGWDGRPTRLFLNLLRQLDAPYLLRVGLDYQLDVYARFGPARLFDVALPYFSLRAAHILMPPLGTIAIDPNSAVALPPLLIPQPDGVASLTVTVPNVPAITGIQVFTQAVLVQYPTQDRLTNANLDVIVR